MHPFRNIPAFLRRQISRFVLDRRGNTAILFALTLIPMLGAVGIALDYSRANSLRSKLQAAADAAALAAGKEQDGTEADRDRIARDVFSANANNLKFTTSYDLAYRDLDDGASARVDVTAKIPTTITGILGIDEIDVHVRAETGLSGGSMEIALVVDNSGSMQGGRISTLKKAARDLVKTLFGSTNNHDSISIGIIPFAASVNVGSQNANASWMDRGGVSSIHYNNLDPQDRTRFEIFDELRNVSWAGCVEARPYPLDVNDTAPGGSNPDSYFVPLFAPDEPDTQWQGYVNSYLDDDGGDCEDEGSGNNGNGGWGNGGWGNGGWNNGGWGNGGWGNGGSNNNLSDEELQKRSCKYVSETVSGGHANSGSSGPNAMCSTRALTTLTNSKGALNSAIGQLTADGYTNIHMGVMWGWRVLSPQAPFTEGKPYSEVTNRKVMVLMTDGANTSPDENTMNESQYSAYGYASENRLGNNLRYSYQRINAMNSRTLTACNNAKSAGIVVYTIAFDIDDQDTRTLLRNCASANSMAYTANSTSDLLAAFEDIAKKLGELRLAK